MPLIKSKSKKAFEKNVKAELAAGKPMKQSLAIAYSVKREAEGRKSSVKGRPTMRTTAVPRKRKK